eukprot:jgi/Botrbrau1/3378/Bobra.0337s0019.1
MNVERAFRNLITYWSFPNRVPRTHRSSSPHCSWDLAAMVDLNVFQFCKCLKQLGKVFPISPAADRNDHNARTCWDFWAIEGQDILSSTS